MVRTPFVDGDFDFWPMYDRGEWEPETREVLERFLGPGTVFIDIGAWIGPVSLWALDLGAFVHAYEPDPEAFKQLFVNTAGRTIRPRKAAVSTRSGWARLTNPRFYGDSQSRIGDDGELVRTIPARWLPIQKAALVKCDIEGHELVVLPDLLGACEAHSVPLYLSWHEELWGDTAVPADVRRSWFEGFELEPIRGDGWSGYSEVLAVPK